MRRKQCTGWILLHREVFASDDFRPGPFNDILAYIWSVQQAAFDVHKRWFKGVQYNLEVGQFVTSQHEMSREFGWTPKKVRLFVERMVRAGRWAICRAGKGAKSPTLVTICNYNEIQRRNTARGEVGVLGTGLGKAKRGRSGDQEENDSKTDKKDTKKLEGKTSIARSKFADEELRKAFTTFPPSPWPSLSSTRPNAKAPW